MNGSDIVTKYIELKKMVKDVEEQIAALETIILSEHRDDDRIIITSGRKTITLTDDAYARLEQIGILTTVTETRKKDIKEFDIDVQTIILHNKDNYTEKNWKESIRIRKG